MKNRTYLAAASLSAIVATILSLASCGSLQRAAEDPERQAQVERKLEQVEQVANAVATTTQAVPGLGTVATVATAISGVIALALNAWRNQTRRTDPAVSNLTAQLTGGTAPPRSA